MTETEATRILSRTGRRPSSSRPSTSYGRRWSSRMPTRGSRSSAGRGAPAGAVPDEAAADEAVNLRFLLYRPRRSSWLVRLEHETATGTTRELATSPQCRGTYDAHPALAPGGRIVFTLAQRHSSRGEPRADHGADDRPGRGADPGLPRRDHARRLGHAADVRAVHVAHEGAITVGERAEPDGPRASTSRPARGPWLAGHWTHPGTGWSAASSRGLKRPPRSTASTTPESSSASSPEQPRSRRRRCAAQREKRAPCAIDERRSTSSSHSIRLREPAAIGAVSRHCPEGRSGACVLARGHGAAGSRARRLPRGSRRPCPR